MCAYVCVCVCRQLEVVWKGNFVEKSLHTLWNKL